MGAMLKKEMPHFNDRIKVLTLLVIVAVLGMAWQFASVINRAETSEARIAGASEQMVLSKSFADDARAAAGGSAKAFPRLEASRNRFAEILQTQVAGFGAASKKTATPEFYALADLENRWRGLLYNINELLDNRHLSVTAGRAAGEIKAAMPQLLGHMQDVVDSLVKSGASAGQLSLASQQLVLGQRMLNSLDGGINGAGVKSGFVAFAEDTLEFGRVLDGFMHGGDGIRALQGQSLQSGIKQATELYSRVTGSIGSIVENAEGLAAIQAAAGNIAVHSESLFDATRNLGGLLKAAPKKSFISKELAYVFGVIALLLLFWRAFEQRSLSRRTAQENAMNQQAITRLLDEMGDLAGGDLTVHTTVSGDFTGSIADSINVTVDSLRGLVKTINDTSTQLSSSVQETEAIAANLLTASKQQSRDITDASTAINAMSVSMNDVSSNASESSKVAMRSVEVARNGGEAVQRTMKGMDTIREHIQETSKRIKRLGESSQEIGDIVELINDIAEQTNILALNASIQAAMAGEAGRGFAVVADEVQRLAERSANATKQIEALVKTIQADTNEAVISMEKSTTGVVNGAQLAENASSSLEEIESISEQLAGLIQNISNSSRSQAEAASDLTATIQGIQEVTTQASSGTEQTSRSIGNLSRLAQDLDTSVAGFKLPQ